MRTRMLLASAAALAAACAMQSIPVEGPRSEVDQLEGLWVGAFSSAESGRHGDITFELAANADTAQGYVYMIPHEGHRRMPVEAEPYPRGVWEDEGGYGLAIEFVRVADGQVRGLLAEYRDPEDGCRLETTFRGEIQGDVIEGTYVTRHLDCGMVFRGSWLVRRRRD